MYLKYVENVIPLSKLIGLLFLFCLPLLSILFLKTKRNDLARPVMGTIFLVIISREISIEHPSVGITSLTQLHEQAGYKSEFAGTKITLFYVVIKAQVETPS